MIEKITVGRVVNFCDLSAHRALAEKLNEVIEAVNRPIAPKEQKHGIMTKIRAKTLVRK